MGSGPSARKQRRSFLNAPSRTRWPASPTGSPARPWCWPLRTTSSSVVSPSGFSMRCGAKGVRRLSRGRRRRRTLPRRRDPAFPPGHLRLAGRSTRWLRLLGGGRASAKSRDIRFVRLAGTGSLPSDLRLPLGGRLTGCLRYVTFATNRDFAGALLAGVVCLTRSMVGPRR
jgi:hypothetical protein